MRLTVNSKKLMNFFINKKCLKGDESLTRNTQTILKRFYKEIQQANKVSEGVLMRDGYRLSIERITTIAEIPKPKLFNANAFPEEVRKHIDETMQMCFSYTFSLFNRDLKVKFIVEEPNEELLVHVYNDYVKKVLVWFNFINKYAVERQCSKSITVYIYLTSLKKKLPESNIHILEENHVNTAFTYTCQINSEIVVFRKEEWLKVLMHETMHNLALDFSDMNYKEVDSKIVELFPVTTRGNSFEAYTEFWAEILNASFCSYYMIPSMKKNAENEFIKNFEFFLQFEKVFGIFQMVKTLNFMGLKYEDLYSKNVKSKIIRDTLYKEKSNILSYYVIRVILLNNWQNFLKWCNTHNKLNSLIQFKKTSENMQAYFEFIKDNYNNVELLEDVKKMEKIIMNLKKTKKIKAGENNKEIDFIENNMRMSITELG